MIFEHPIREDERNKDNRARAAFRYMHTNAGNSPMCRIILMGARFHECEYRNTPDTRDLNLFLIVPLSENTFVPFFSRAQISKCTLQRGAGAKYKNSRCVKYLS